MIAWRHKHQKASGDALTEARADRGWRLGASLKHAKGCWNLLALTLEKEKAILKDPLTHRFYQDMDLHPHMHLDQAQTPRCG